MFKVETIQDAKHLFEESSEYLRITRTPRAMGPHHESRQLIFDDVDIKVPLVFGPKYDQSQPTIENLFRLTDISLLPIGSHIIFNSGEYEAVHFRRYKAEHMNFHEGGVSDVNGVYREYLLNLEIRGGIFHGAVRFSNSRIGNVTISGGIFEEPVVFERGVFGAIRISGGEFKKGISFGKMELFPSETPFFPPPANSKPWRSNYNGIYSSFEFTMLNECTVDLSNLMIKTDLIVDARKAEVRISGIQASRATKLYNGNITEQDSRYDTIEIGRSSTLSKLQLTMANTKLNDLAFKGVLSKESGISITVLDVSSLSFRGFISQATIIWDRLALVGSRINLSDIKENPVAQSLNRSQYYTSAFNEGIKGGGFLNEIYKYYEPALAEIPEYTTEFVKSTLTITNSDLGKMTFIQSQLDVEVSFENSKLNELSLLASDFPLDKWSNGTNHSQRRLALFQLKKAYEGSGDTHSARILKARELEAHRQALKLTNEREEKFTLRLNQLSNSYGESWTRAALWLFGLGACLWMGVSFLFFDLGYVPKESCKIFIQSLAYMIEFSNPVHKLGFIEEYVTKVAGFDKDSIPPVPLAIANLADALWRIVAAYLIYQMVAAFRKHGSK
jgi:hypothetical protein